MIEEYHAFLSCFPSLFDFFFSFLEFVVNITAAYGPSILICRYQLQLNTYEGRVLRKRFLL